jgi:hypothetical protein
MTSTAVEPDSRGVDALSGQLDGNLLQPLIFQQLAQEMAQQLDDAPWPQQLPEFDDTPWRQLPTVEDMESLWLASAPIDSLIAKLGHRAHGEGPDLMEFMAQQWRMADLELEFKRAREAQGAEGTVDGGGAAAAATIASAETRRGGGGFPRGSEDGDTVGEGGEAEVAAHPGPASKVSGRRRPRKA